LTLEDLEEYFNLVTPYISSQSGVVFSVDAEIENVHVYTKDAHFYISEEQINLLKAGTTTRKLEEVGEFPFNDDFEFFTVLYNCLSVVIHKNNKLFDTLFAHKTKDWREFAVYIAHVLDLETELTENGLFIQDIGEIEEVQEGATNKLVLHSVKLFDFVWEPDTDSKLFRIGVLQLLHTVYSSDEFIQKLNLIISTVPEEEEEAPMEAPDMGGGDAGPTMEAAPEEGGDSGADMGGDAVEASKKMLEDWWQEEHYSGDML
jgi:hypothetical protein